MNVYLSDDEQVEKLKFWIKKYGSSIIVGVLMGLALMYGWQYWVKKQTEKSIAALEQYNILISLSDKKDNFSDLKAKTAAIVNDYPNTPYAIFANLLLAQKAVAENNYTQAVSSLTWVIEQGTIDPFRQIARIRLARILIFQKNYQQALEVLKIIPDPSFDSLINEAKGDIYFAMGDKNQARQFYQQALKNAPLIGMFEPILSMKLNNIESLVGDAK